MTNNKFTANTEMCGRARCRLSPDSIKSLAKANIWNEQELYKQMENLSPSKAVPVLYQENTHGKWERVLRSMTWGLIPSFTDANTIPDFFKMHNARVESIHDKPSFKRLVNRRRCVVFIDGYYEWRSEAGEKQPYLMYFQHDRPIAVAGVYDIWHQQTPDGLQSRYTCSMITGPANSHISKIHTRQPVLLSTEHLIENWLNYEIPFQTIIKLVPVPYSGSDLIYHPVHPRMSKGTYQGMDCSAPIQLTSKIISLFR